MLTSPSGPSASCKVKPFGFPASPAVPAAPRKSTSKLGSSLAAPSFAFLQEKPYLRAQMCAYMKIGE